MKISILAILFATIFLNAQQLNTNSKELYLKYTKYPKIIYTNQRFSVELEAIILSDKTKFNVLTSSYHNGKNIEILTKNVYWENISNNRYKATIDYKVKNRYFKLPDIRLALEFDSEDNYFENDEYNYIEIAPPKIKYTTIAINQNSFSNIIATDLRIKSVTAKQYNNKMLMVVCNIEATNSNLEEFKLAKFEEQGINSFEDDYPNQSIFYYLIVPSHINSINFNYFNPKLDKFVDVKLPIMLEDNLISTQTDLNPNNGNMLKYKKIIVLIFLMILIIIYLFKRNIITIIFILVVSYMAVMLFIPNKKIILHKDTKVYILPTQTSTIYKIINKKQEVEILLTKQKFIKVLFKNKNIGWIKEKDV